MMAKLSFATLFLVGLLAMMSAERALAAFTTEELFRLKTSGVAEDLIRMMIDSGYSDVGRVIKLKEMGFKDETILSVIKSDLKERGAQQPLAVQAESVAQDRATDMQTTAKVKIERYLVYGDPIVQNSQEIESATVSLQEGGRLKFEWAGDKGLLALDDYFQMKPFASPFYWDLNQGDAFGPAERMKNVYVLQSARAHKGRPATDDTHYWVISFEPANAEIAERIKLARGVN